MLRQRPKKLSLSRQKKIIQLFANLFASGFHLSEMIAFLQRSQLLEDAYTTILKEGLMAGKSFSGLLADLQFSDSVVTQLSLSEVHGNLAGSLAAVEDYLTNLTKVQKKLVEVATYPVLLLTFLVLMMLGLRHYLLPQLEEGNVATQLMNRLPLIFFTVGAVLVLVGVLLTFWYRRTAKIQAISRLAGVPVLGLLLQTYLTAYYAREWGNLIGQGLELGQIVVLMQEQSSALFREIGRETELALANGQTFHDHIQTYPFFKKELGLIIEYGQVKSKLGSELLLYGEECWEEFFAKVHLSMQWIQPLVFLFVALMIVLMYAAMLLPIYQQMEI